MKTPQLIPIIALGLAIPLASQAQDTQPQLSNDIDFIQASEQLSISNAPVVGQTSTITLSNGNKSGKANPIQTYAYNPHVQNNNVIATNMKKYMTLWNPTTTNSFAKIHPQAGISYGNKGNRQTAVAQLSAPQVLNNGEGISYQAKWIYVPKNLKASTYLTQARLLIDGTNKPWPF